MEKNYIIAWKSLSNGRVGRGKNIFSEDQARSMAVELNREHPGFDHVAVPENEENLIAVFSSKSQPEKVLVLHSLPETHHSHSAEKHTDEPSLVEKNILKMEREEHVNPFLDDEMTGT
jgi:hypothetical protein